jgi:hypothetical protein
VDIETNQLNAGGFLQFQKTVVVIQICDAIVVVF